MPSQTTDGPRDVAHRPGTESHIESPNSELLPILSQQKIFNYFMHMRAKTICGFYIISGIPDVGYQIESSLCRRTKRWDMYRSQHTLWALWRGTPTDHATIGCCMNLLWQTSRKSSQLGNPSHSFSRARASACLNRVARRGLPGQRAAKFRTATCRLKILARCMDSKLKYIMSRD